MKHFSLFKMALDIRKEILREEHPATAMAYNIRKKILGSAHPETKESKEYLEILRICWDKEL